MPGIALQKHLSIIVCVFTALLGAACGGGGGSSNSNGGGSSGSDGIAATPIHTPTPIPEITVPEIATESSPVGAVVDIAGLNLLPLSIGDHWDFDTTDANGNAIGAARREVAALSADFSVNGVKVSETSGTSSDTTIAVKQGSGIFVDYTLDSSLPAQAARQIGLVREYAVPAYAIGETRTIIRQGVWDGDFDEDGKPEQFRLEYTQVFRGFESLTLPWNTATAARFSNAYRFTVTGSRSGEVRGVVSNEEAYLAQDIGPVKLVRHDEDLQGNPINGFRTLMIKTATVGGKTFGGSPATL
jgi:hypothetical protein